MPRRRPTMAALSGMAMLATAVTAAAQGAAPAASSHRPAARVSFTIDTRQRGGGDRTSELATSVHLTAPELDGSGVEYGLNVRQSQRNGGAARRLSIYDAFAGVRLGSARQLRLRAGHMWLTDLGTVGALAGGLIELQRTGGPSGVRIRGGAFAGREPLVYEFGYAPDVRKAGGYVAVERGFLQRHVVGYTRVQQGPITERSVVSVTNFVPAGTAAFIYQAAEFDVSGPADGTAAAGLSYFLTNARVTASKRVELLGTYNRGRSIDARTLSDDVRNGRAIAADRVEGLIYESAGGRVTVEVAANTRVYAGYARDRVNRDDSASGRTTVGGHAGNVFRTGIDVSASNTRVDRAMGAYQSRYFSVGRSIGRSIYASVDYATSLSVVRFVRSDGLVVETNPWMRRWSGNGSITIGRHLSLLTTFDYERDDIATHVRVLSGLAIRM